MLSLPSIVDDPFEEGKRNKEPSDTISAILKLWGIIPANPNDESRLKLILQTLTSEAHKFTLLKPRGSPLLNSVYYSTQKWSKNLIYKHLISAFIAPTDQEMVQRGIFKNHNGIKYKINFIEKPFYY